LKDALTTSPDSAMAAIRPQVQERIDALKGMFEYTDTRQPQKKASSAMEMHAEIKSQLGVNACSDRWRTANVGILVLSCMLSGQVYASLFMKNEAHMHDKWQKGWALALGFISFGLCAASACVLHLVTAALLRIFLKAKKMRQFFTIQVYDTIIMDRLPNMYGVTEQLLVLGFCTTYLTFGIIAVVTIDAGVFAFGHVLAMYVLFVGNAFAGEPSSLMTIRKRGIFEAMKETAKVAGVDIDTNTLKHQIDDFLEHDVHQDTVIISLKFLAILVATFDYPKPDSVRLRRFIVQSAFVDAGTSTLDCRRVEGVHDVAVDTFSGSCTILGKHSNAERWEVEGHRLSWHTVLRPQLVSEVEKSLTEHGMKLGRGLSSGKGLHEAWASIEAWRQPQRCLEAAEVAKAELEARTVALLGLCMMDKQLLHDDVVAPAVLPLLQAGVDVNNTSMNIGGRTALWYASGCGTTMYQKPETAKLLVDYGADPTLAGKEAPWSHALSYSCASPLKTNDFFTELMKRWEAQRGKAPKKM